MTCGMGMGHGKHTLLRITLSPLGRVLPSRKMGWDLSNSTDLYLIPSNILEQNSWIKSIAGLQGRLLEIK